MLFFSLIWREFELASNDDLPLLQYKKAREEVIQLKACLHFLPSSKLKAVRIRGVRTTKSTFGCSASRDGTVRIATIPTYNFSSRSEELNMEEKDEESQYLSKIIEFQHQKVQLEKESKELHELSTSIEQENQEKASILMYMIRFYFT